MDLQLAGKTAVVTAASGGIGGAVVRTLLGEGVRVLAADVAVSTELKESGAVTVEADLLTEEGVEALRRAAEAEFDGIDLLVNVVGGMSGLDITDFSAITDETWERAFRLNFYSSVRITKALESRLRESVVNVSSSVARWPGQGPYYYGSSKAALTAWAKALADEYGKRGIRVNTVSPGLIRTPLWDEYGPKVSAEYGMEFDEFATQITTLAQVTAGRWGTGQEVADLIVFLSSPVAGYITGADYLIDGGMQKVL
ncbi:SDR family NAD(P)-dependent oxidoreductase [Streptomyces sp. NPDC058953]|uniref:SDR family NAD(P)-dependent oxidoreductase n=1 Tax=unclassified Streptomyces TaxID=2593676 RepID=UPI00367CF544